MNIVGILDIILYILYMFSFFFINNVPLFVYKEYKDLTILQFCEFVYLLIPRFCYHDKLTVAGNCRMCMVEVTASIKPIIACATNIGYNMEVFTETSFVKRARENVLEFLLINHPLDCPICDQAGECDLQDQSLMYGSDRGRFKEMKRSVDDKEFGPVIKTIMTRCIHCTRCVRFADEIAGVHALGTIGRGMDTEIKMVLKNFFDSEISGNVVDLCPVGALTSKPYAFTGRPWELKSIETIDPLDGLNSNIRIDVKGNRIFRILPKKNEYVNEEWISDLIRFSYESVQFFRVKFPYLNIQNSNYLCALVLSNRNFVSFRSRVSWEQCWELIKLLMNMNFQYSFFFLGNEVGAFISYMFYMLFQHSYSSYLFIENEFQGLMDFRKDYLFSSSIDSLFDDNYYFVYNLNLKEALPVLNARIKKHFSNTLYRKYVLYIGSNVRWTFLVHHIGFSYWSFFCLFRGENLSSNFFLKLSSRKLSILSDSLYSVFDQFLNRTNIFDLVSFHSCYSFSNLMSFYEFGFKGTNASCIELDFLKNMRNFSYFLKTNTKDIPDFVGNEDSFSVYQGTYLPDFFDKNVFNYVFFPSSNIFEQEDIYCNIIGNLQYTNQVVDFSEREEVYSDFFIVKNMISYFLFNFKNKYSSTGVNLDILSNEIVFFFLNYFCFLFDSIPFYRNVFLSNSFYVNNGFFLPIVRNKFDWFTYFYVNYSKTLRNSFFLRYKNMDNFSYYYEI